MLDDDLGKDESLGLAIIDILKAGQSDKFWVNLKGVKSGRILLSLNVKPSRSPDEAHESRVHSAATTIQAGYRGMVAKQDKKVFEKRETSEKSLKILEDRKENLQSNFTIQDVTPMNNPEYYQYLSEDTNIPANVDTKESEKAAIKIQSGYRGMRARRRVRDLRSRRLTAISEEMEHGVATVVQPGLVAIKLSKKGSSGDSENEIETKDSGKPKQEDAATVIQNGYKESKYTEDEQKVNEAATLIQSGYKMVKSQQLIKSMENAEPSNEESETNKATDAMFGDWKVVEMTKYGEPTVIKIASQASGEEDNDEKVMLRESSGKVARVGAIPFELHEANRDKDEPDYSFNNTEESDKKTKGQEPTVEEEAHHSMRYNRETSIIKTKGVDEDSKMDDVELYKEKMKMIEEFDANTPVDIYIVPDTPESQKVLFYLKERKIPHSTKNISELEVFDDWFLDMSPKTALPVLKYNNEDIITESLKIMSFLEQKVPVDVYPMMIPCTTSTKLYQKYIFYASLLDQIDFDAIALGANVNSANLGIFKSSLEKKRNQMEAYIGMYTKLETQFDQSAFQPLILLKLTT